MFHLKTRISGFLCALLIFLLAGTALAAETAGTGFSDTQAHWAGQAITDWAGQGLTGGYPDGTFRPDNQVSRAEFIALLNRALGLEKAAAINFSDVAVTNWFYRDIAIAAEAGFVTGYLDGTMKPAHPISREEAAVIMARVLKLADNPSGTQAFSDHQEIASWSRVAVGAVSSSLYMGGYPDGTFAPAKPITRAESVTILSRIAGSIYRTAGVYGTTEGTQTIAGNVTVTTGGITLQNMVIDGTLHLSAGIGSESVTLKNVTVKGTTLVCGGGANSIILDEGTVLGRVIVDRQDGTVRIFAKKGSSVRIVVAENGLILDQESGTEDAFTELVVSVPAGVVVEIRGHVATLTVESPETTVNVLSGASVGTLIIADTAMESSIDLAAGASVTNVEINAPVDVTGKGTIDTATINADGVTIAQEPKEVVLADNITSEVGGETVYGEETDEEVGGGGGGGGGVGGGTTSAVDVTGITLTFDGDSNILDSSSPYEISIPSSYDSDTLFTGFEISADPTAETMIITDVELDGNQWLNQNITRTLADGSLSTRDILGSLDTGEIGVNLGSLRAMGSTLMITGYVLDADDGESDPFVVTITLQGGSLDLSLVNNKWLEFDNVGYDITGTIRSGEGASLLKNVEVLEVLFQGPVKINDISCASAAAVKACLESETGVDWDVMTLQDLATYNVEFEYTNPDSMVVTLRIEGDI